MQEGNVIFYESRKLKEHKRNYVARDLELEETMHGLKMWRHYFLGRRFVFMLDHG